MITYHCIEKNLEVLDEHFKRSRHNRDAIFASKLAILELCGWIEVSMDECILSASERVLKETKNIRFVENKVGRNYGFSYEDHFKPMLANLIGA